MCVFLASGITLANSSKLLVLPYGMYSHVNIFTKLGKALKDDGHEVWLLTYDHYGEKIEKAGLTPLTFPLKREDDLMAQLDEWMVDSPGGEGILEKFLNDEHWLMANSRVCDAAMQNEHIQATIAKEKFDLVIFDGVDEFLCLLMIPYKFDIPFLTVHGFQTTSWVSGVTGMPSIEPEIDTIFSNRMTFWERIENLKSWLARYNNFYYDLYNDHHMGSYCPAHKPKISLKEVAEKSEMYLMNFEIMCLDYPRVSAPNMQYLGASSATPAKPLPEDLEAFVAGAEHGVVVMTLGSMKAAQHLWKVMGPRIFEAFGRLPQRILVQYRLDEVHGEVPANVKLMKWMPQNDILGHPKTKLFVMHGGNNGQNEAIYHGVPMLVIPVMGDQMYCGERVQAHGYGFYVKDKPAVTSDDLYQMMNEIITNGSYSANIKKCSAIIRSLPSAQEKFVFWVDHILKFGGAHLRPPSLDMPLYQVLMLDILAYYAGMALLAIHGGLFVLYFVVKYALKYFKPKKD